MNKRFKIYLDTSVINFLFADDAPEKRDITIEFFRNFIKTSIYETYVSQFVIAEIEDTLNEDKKAKLLNVIAENPIDFIEINNLKEIEGLAAKYIESGIIPEKKYADAYHIATCVTHQINYLVNWNYKHLANINKEQKVKLVNIANNYLNEIRIITPLELMSYGN